MSPVRTRIAPSPTGPLHIGTARTALFNYLYTRKVGGQFLMRLEDTDRERSTPEFEKQIYEGLKWLGLHWDEGPDIGGPCAPYRQSERADIYKKHLDILIRNGRAYPCFCTAEELEEERKEFQSQKLTTKYMDKCRKIPSGEAAHKITDGIPHAYRFAMPEEKIAFQDLIKGEVEFDCSMIADFVIATADGRYIFHLTNIVDDITMKITHVIRGEDHLSNTPKHIALARAMECEAPQYGHIPLTLNPDKSKMSKRKGTVDLEEYKNMGYLPEAVVNFLAFLGWSPGTEEEVFSLDELVQRFSINAISKSNAIFNIDKLNWINGLYVRRMPKDNMADRLSGYLPNVDKNYLMKIIPLIQDRIKRLDEAVEYAKFFFEDPKDYDVKLIIAKKQTAAESTEALTKVKTNLDKLPEFTVHSMEDMMRSLVEELGWKAGPLFMIVRVAITGATATPPLFETMEVLGKDVCLRRLDYAIGKLSTAQSG